MTLCCPIFCISPICEPFVWRKPLFPKLGLLKLICSQTQQLLDAVYSRGSQRLCWFREMLRGVPSLCQHSLCPGGQCQSPPLRVGMWGLPTQTWTLAVGQTPWHTGPPQPPYQRSFVSIKYRFELFIGGFMWREKKKFPKLVHWQERVATRTECFPSSILSR